MKKSALILIAILYSIVSFAQNTRSTSSLGTNPKVTYQNGYVKPSTGTYVNGHYKTESNGTNKDNFSTKSNTNPYTGTSGTKQQDYSVGAQQNNSTKDIQTGPRGGQYYINSNGNKTYVPKSK